jgi:hypothetical protein
VFCGVFIAEEVDRLGGKGSQDTTTGGILTLLEAFLNLPLFHFQCFFSGKKQNLQIIRHWLKGILPHMLPQFMLSVATVQ